MCAEIMHPARPSGGGQLGPGPFHLRAYVAKTFASIELSEQGLFHQPAPERPLRLGGEALRQGRRRAVADHVTELDRLTPDLSRGDSEELPEMQRAQRKLDPTLGAVVVDRRRAVMKAREADAQPPTSR